ncbi:sperm-associated antigen 5 [Ahaetulla prasina]|uniref:sperm-associated antigen 5 n=1 Tax=Ahaetulla prasina TaxID=499056 RepID=UPI002649C028|nr:sperm-associated antigen 5 [Ahaetulla prasina]
MAESGAPGQDPVASFDQNGPNGSPAPGNITWTVPLVWLEQLLPTSPMLADLRRSLSIGVPQQEEGSTRTLELGATAGPVPPWSHESPCLGPALLQDHRTSTPVSEASPGARATPTCCQDLGPKSPLEQAGPTASPCLAALEADATASPEGQELPVVCQDPSTAHVSLAGCGCHGLWGSPLSVLGDGLDASLAGKEPPWQGPKRMSTNPPCLTCAQACTLAGGLPQQNRGTSVTPVSVASAAAGTSQLSLREAGVNTSPAEKATTTDNTAETDSLLWHCSRDQLSHLSRAELEERLESTLIIMDALSHQIRAAQDFRRSAAPVGPADQRDAATQTPTADSIEDDPVSKRPDFDQAGERLYHRLYLEQRLRFRSLQGGQKNLQGLAQQLEGANEEMRVWSSNSRQLQAKVDTAFQQLQDDRRSLCQQQKQMGRLLAQARSQIQHWGQKQQEMSRELEAPTRRWQRVWSSNSRQLQAKVDTAFQQLQDDRRSLCQQQKQMGRLLAQARSQIQHWGQKQQEMSRELEAALKAKDTANLVRESVQAGAAAKIRKLEPSAESQQRLWVLLQKAKALEVDLLSGYGRHVAEGDSLAAALQADWAQMRLDYQGYRSSISKCLVANRKMAEEVEAARTESARFREVCQKLEETTVELVEALGRVNELVETNMRLDRDLQAALARGTASEEQLQQLQEERLELSQRLEEKATAIQQLQDEAARLAQEKERVQQERDGAQRDFREASDCREFLEQENQVARRQLSETEEELKASLSALRERGSQLEDLKDARQKLQQEQESLRAELDGARAKIQDTKMGLEGLFRAVLELGGLHTQFLEVADILQTGRPGAAAQVAPQSSTSTPAQRTPHRPGVSLVDSVLRAASQGAPKTPGLWSETTAFTRAAPAPPPQLSDILASLASHTQDLRLAVEQLRLLARRCQEDIGELRAQILQMEQQLETSQTQHQAEMDACRATQIKLSKILHLKIQSEKELQELLRQQEEKQCQLSDQKREVATLREEVAQLKLELQKSEMAATTLWDEMSGTRRPDAQEKIWLRQEVGKLKELLLQKDTEHTKALTSHVTQVRCLEERLCQAQQLLRRQEKVEANLKQALSRLPTEVSSLTEIQRLVDLLV